MKKAADQATEKVNKAVGKTVAKAAGKAMSKTPGKAAEKPIPRGMARSDEGSGEPFSVFVSDLDQYLFGKGVHYDIYKKLGAHEAEKDGKMGVYFAVWAPHAAEVFVIGSFNAWNEYSHPMKKTGDVGIWDLFVPEANKGDLYKFLVVAEDGRKLYKADPFANQAEIRPGTASVVTDIEHLRWSDKAWMEKQKKWKADESPVAVYEVHPGSWMKHPHGPEENGFYTYRQFADRCVDYVKEMGYTHVELLPVMEHPLDASWGYQVTGYYAPTARNGSPKEFKALVDAFHNAGIGVILDWVPGHFCPDDCGLREFNGDKLYESEIHPDWGTYKFDFARPQVRSFLYSNAMFWLEEYHIAGIRVDGVSSMLYLNFGITDRSKMKYNIYGDEGNLEAIEFLKELNHMVGTYVPGACMIAEESTAWPMITWPPEKGGLGFHFKWNMGWMHDTLEYMSCDFPWRSDNHNKLTFSMTYAYSENFILPLSHDEVVHGKRSLIGRMPGDIWRQFAGIRLLSMYQMTHPGKKLNFMGHEIAQFIEWREYEGLEWFLLQYENHEKYQKYIKTINQVYKEHPALWSN
ncbi:MAG: 1,4-alpha-glucan branching protein GlgB, partial [Eubacteriaceae bacterium]|nr:1,4-alpha-glucan branching protein GlgB [Eubacteriaceae bacterium]